MVCLKTETKPKAQQEKTQPLTDSYFCSGAEILVPQADSKTFQSSFSIYLPNEQGVFDLFLSREF